MGCTHICFKKSQQSLSSYIYELQQFLLKSLLNSEEFTDLSHCYCNDFVIKCHKKLLQNPSLFILKYTKKLQQKQTVPYQIIEKWKLILFGTNISSSKNYIDCIGFDKLIQQQRIVYDKVYKVSQTNPFEIKLQQLYFHESYPQIQKDSIRSYNVPQIKPGLFENILKKIANFFPQTGYILGINYIIGYFLLIGLSEIDSFWMFIHLALNEKYLIIGLYQKQFPLAHFLMKLLKNIIKRKNRFLYQHLYHNIFSQDKSWIMKCFLTFFLSIFPIQLCHYIFDYIITYGILGLPIVLVAFFNFIERDLMKCQDIIDFGQKIKSYRQLKNILQEINLWKFMKSVYEIDLEIEDFYDINIEQKQNNQSNSKFYEQYFINYSNWKFKKNNKNNDSRNRRNSIDILSIEQQKKNMEILLENWYDQIIKKRENFKQQKSRMQTITGKNFYVPQKKRNQGNSKDENFEILQKEFKENENKLNSQDKVSQINLQIQSLKFSRQVGQIWLQPPKNEQQILRNSKARIPILSPSKSQLLFKPRKGHKLQRPLSADYVYSAIKNYQQKQQQKQQQIFVKYQRRAVSQCNLKIKNTLISENDLHSLRQSTINQFHNTQNFIQSIIKQNNNEINHQCESSFQLINLNSGKKIKNDIRIKTESNNHKKQNTIKKSDNSNLRNYSKINNHNSKFTVFKQKQKQIQSIKVINIIQKQKQTQKQKQKKNGNQFIQIKDNQTGFHFIKSYDGKFLQENYNIRLNQYNKQNQLIQIEITTVLLDKQRKQQKEQKIKINQNQLSQILKQIDQQIKQEEKQKDKDNNFLKQQIQKKEYLLQKQEQNKKQKKIEINKQQYTKQNYKKQIRQINDKSILKIDINHQNQTQFYKQKQIIKQIYRQNTQQKLQKYQNQLQNQRQIVKIKDFFIGQNLLRQKSITMQIPSSLIVKQQSECKQLQQQKNHQNITKNKNNSQKQNKNNNNFNIQQQKLSVKQILKYEQKQQQSHKEIQYKQIQQINFYDNLQKKQWKILIQQSFKINNNTSILNEELNNKKVEKIQQVMKQQKNIEQLTQIQKQQQKQKQKQQQKQKQKDLILLKIDSNQLV